MTKYKTNHEGIPQEIYKSFYNMTYRKLNKFIENELPNHFIKGKPTKGSGHFVRIPTVILQQPIESETDKLIFILTIHLFNYGNRYKKLDFTFVDFRETFGLNYTPKKLQKLIEGVYEIIKIEYIRPFFHITYNDELVVDIKNSPATSKVTAEITETTKVTPISEFNKYDEMKLIDISGLVNVKTL